MIGVPGTQAFPAGVVDPDRIKSFVRIDRDHAEFWIDRLMCDAQDAGRVGKGWLSIALEF
ncbi:hypothetical protein C7I55_07390 [Sphingomonas deserti]|uniref:Uncharacterized protein n=1 Tax=Allosphingosinicella deserti TaxID=2116704 RepID=A0A2P7QVR7_9SPHN|nr:hypothetical protein C7I55_07390 [Sphingomonas deserti]